MMKMWQNRAQKLRERRKLDVQDEAADCAASVGSYHKIHNTTLVPSTHQYCAPFILASLSCVISYGQYVYLFCMLVVI